MQSRLTPTDRRDRLAPPERSPTPRAMAEWFRDGRHEDVAGAEAPAPEADPDRPIR